MSMDNITVHERTSSLAQEVIQISKGQLLVNLRFLDRALFELKLKEDDVFTLATDGRTMFYQPRWLLQQYRDTRNFVMRGYLHCLMHCLFRHMFVSTAVDVPMWDLACDVAAEAMIQELNLLPLQDNGAWVRAETLKTLKGEIKLMTAEKIYAWLLDHPNKIDRLERWIKQFEVDDHTLWYIRVPAGGDGEGEGDGENDPNDPNVKTINLGKSGGEMSRNELEEMWKDISERMQTDLETFSKQHGDSAGNFVQSLRALNREKCDYAAFLRKFATRCEVMHTSPDEFDYVFYTYGLELYEDMPLIEPLEYRDEKRIRDFVIAIDTSGSVSGELVQTFLQKTFNILKQEETFARRFNLHIIQCDADIQEDVLITTQEEFDHYIAGMKLRGFGGTDFRPVFEYVEKLRRDKAFRDLRGMIYFTDGYGTYPAKMPDYQTAFVFVEDDDYAEKLVPAWAIRVILEKDNIPRIKE